MKKKEKSLPKELDFSEQTPDMQIEEEVYNRLYERAFLSREEAEDGEYTRNTTTWD